MTRGQGLGRLPLPVLLEEIGARLGDLVAILGGDASLSPCSEEESGLSGSFRVVMLDPEQKTPWVQIIYRVRPLDEAECLGRVEAEDFAVEAGTLKAYDQDGLPFDPDVVQFGLTF